MQTPSALNLSWMPEWGWVIFGIMVGTVFLSSHLRARRALRAAELASEPEKKVTAEELAAQWASKPTEQTTFQTAASNVEFYGPPAPNPESAQATNPV